MSNDGGSVRALILAGGSGTRLWPRSTDSRPKPFLSLTGRESFLSETFARAARIAGPEGVSVSARRAHGDLVRQELPQLPEARLILEPVRRNTAPAIALAALLVAAEDPEALLVVMPSDQAVRDEERFQSCLSVAVDAARSNDAFVTLGIPPTRPETGFGYLQAQEDHTQPFMRVLRFVEKPSLARAREFLAEGSYLWNAGIFVFRVKLLLREMGRFCPDVLSAVTKAAAALREGDAAGFDRAFSSAPSISIDYAVMERADEVLVVSCPCGWSDLGSWDSVFEFRGGSLTQNVLEGDARSVRGEGNLVLAREKPILVIGLSGVVVIDAPEGILVMRQEESDALRSSVEEILARRAS